MRAILRTNMTRTLTHQDDLNPEELRRLPRTYALLRIGLVILLATALVLILR